LKQNFRISASALSMAALLFCAASVEAANTEFANLESINYDEVCGVTAAGKTACLKSQETATWIPDPVGNLSSAHQNDVFGCGKDADGWQCWKMTAGAINGTSFDLLFRKFLESAKPNSVRLSTSNACSVNLKTSALHCIMPYWQTRSKELIKSPKYEIRAIGVHNDYVCWADGNLIECQAEYRPWAWPKKMEISKPLEIAVGDNFICARSLTESKCWSEEAAKPEVAVDTTIEIKSAQSWLPRRDVLCALTKDKRFICAKPSTGEILDYQESGYSVPKEFWEPNPDVQDAWASESSGCVNLNNGSVTCWSQWNSSLTQVEFREPVNMIFGAGYAPCGLLQSGQVECRLTYIDSATLPKPDRVRIEFGGYNKCFWNSGGIECRGRNEKIEFKSVKSVAVSSSGEALCVVGVQRAAAHGFDSVKCFSYNSDLTNPPFEFSNPTKVAVSEDRACAISDDGLTCWGESYQGFPPPTNVSNPKKLMLATSHGCVLDDFGFACWGDLANLQLEVPSGLEQPGRVKDFALGSSLTCVTLEAGNVECWGRDFDRTGQPPPLQNTTSILGRGSLFCALDETGLHCWGGYTDLPR
jgi:hypothetical protein